MTITESGNLMRPGFIADASSINRNGGRQVEFDSLPDSYRAGVVANTITVNDASVLAGEVGITVVALPVDIPAGTFLNFGTYAPVTVTINDASISAGDTSITVVALPGPLPIGTVLDFGGGTNAQIVKLSAAAAAGATTITVAAADGTIANSSTALFSGGTIQAKVTTFAAAGATALVVDELQFGIADASTATFYTEGSGPKVVAAGTVMCELSTGKLFPRSLHPGSEAAVGILETEASEKSNGVLAGFGLIVGGVLYENLLPDAAGDPLVISSTYKTELEASGTGFSWQAASNSMWT